MLAHLKKGEIFARQIFVDILITHYIHAGLKFQIKKKEKEHLYF